MQLRKRYKLTALFTLGIVGISLMTWPKLQADVCSEGDDNYVRVTQVSDTSVRFDLCSKRDGFCSPLGNKLAYSYRELEEKGSSEFRWGVGKVVLGTVGLAATVAAGIAAAATWTASATTAKVASAVGLKALMTKIGTTKVATNLAIGGTAGVGALTTLFSTVSGLNNFEKSKVLSKDYITPSDICHAYDDSIKEYVTVLEDTLDEVHGQAISDGQEKHITNFASVTYMNAVPGGYNQSTARSLQ